MHMVSHWISKHLFYTVRCRGGICIFSEYVNVYVELHVSVYVHVYVHVCPPSLQPMNQSRLSELSSLKVGTHLQNAHAFSQVRSKNS